MLLEALSILAADLLPSADEPLDLGRRGNCQVAAWMAIMHLRNVSTGLSHGLGHQLGALLGVPHGVTSCILLPHAMDFNRPVTAGRQALLAPALGVDVHGLDELGAAAAVADCIRSLLAQMGVPTRLSEIGVERSHFEAIVEEAMNDMILAGNPRAVSIVDALALLEAAY